MNAALLLTLSLFLPLTKLLLFLHQQCHLLMLWIKAGLQGTVQDLLTGNEGLDRHAQLILQSSFLPKNTYPSWQLWINIICILQFSVTQCYFHFSTRLETTIRKKIYAPLSTEMGCTSYVSNTIHTICIVDQETLFFWFIKN